MYVELWAALKIFENFLFSFNGGQNFSILIGWAAKRTRSWLVEHAFSAFSWLFEKFCSEFSNVRLLQILTFKPTSVEKRGNQAIAWRELKKGEPKASYTNSKRLFALKAETLEHLARRLCVFGEIRLLWSRSSTFVFVSSLQLPISQKCCKLKKTAQSFLHGWKGAGQSQWRKLLCNFVWTRHLQFIVMCKASQHTLMHANKSTCLEL